MRADSRERSKTISIINTCLKPYRNTHDSDSLIHKAYQHAKLFTSTKEYKTYSLYLLHLMQNSLG